jgi:glycosyltransferase 2 family protein
VQLRNWRFWLGLVVSLLFLYLAFRGQDFGQIWDSLLQVNYLFLAPALLIYFVGVWVRTVRWHYLLRPTGSISSRRLFSVVVIGYMANDVLPARMGEVVRAYVLGEREGLSKTAVFATIVVERMLDGLVMLLFMVVGSFTIAIGSSLEWMVRMAALLFIGGMAFFFVMASSRDLTSRLKSAMTRVLPVRIGDRVVRLFDSFITGLQILRSGWALAVAFGLSVAAWLFEAGMYFVIGLGFGFVLPVNATLLSTAVANLATLVPSSPGYVGTFEGAIRLVLEPIFHFPSDTALSFAVVLHAALYFPITFWGFYYWWRQSLSLREIQSTAGSKTGDLSPTGSRKV